MGPRQNTKHFALLLFLWASAALVTGCREGGANTEADAYLRQLVKALPAAYIDRAPARIPEPPETGAGPIDIHTGGYRHIDILSLRGCGLKSTVIQAGSLLGQNAKPSQRLKLVLAFLRTAPDCINQLRQRGDDRLALTLETLQQDRQHALPHAIFHATLGSEAYRALWAGTPVPRSYPTVAQHRAMSALAIIDRQAGRWLDADYRMDQLEFELLLSEMAGGAAGTILLATSRQAASLSTANRLLRSQLQTCDTHNRREASRLLGASRRFFLTRVQPRYSALLEQLGELQSAGATLEQRLDRVLPMAFRRWQTDRDRHIEALRDAPSTHLALLAKVQEACARP